MSEKQTNAEIKPGDVVRLESGGPLMTVSHLACGKVWTQWFDNKDRMQSGGFRAYQLRVKLEPKREVNPLMPL
jgi:uncharacterized protein YodC (DUF2158 family)